MNITIFTTSDYPYKGASENFVRLMSFGLKIHCSNLKITRFWGSRFNNINDTSILCNNYLFAKPFKGFILKSFEAILQIIYVPFYLFKLKFKYNENVLLLYGFDRIYIILPIIFFCRIYKIKCFRIITEEYPINLKHNLIFSHFIKLSEFFQSKYIDKYLNGIIVLSNYLKLKSISNGVNAKKIILINHFIEISDDFNSYNSNSIDKFIIGFSGTLTPENGIIDLINSFLILNNKYPDQYLLILIGEIPKYLEEFIKHNSIIFTGLLPHEKALNKLRECNVLVNPARDGILSASGFPTKLAEYLSSGIPVISSNVDNLQEYFIDKKEVFFYEKNSTNSLIQKIYEVSLDINLSREVGINGRLWAMNNLEYKQNAKKLLHFIEIN